MSDHHILVIDDDERLRLLLRRFLEESGFRVTDASDASQAKQVLENIEFDLLVVDIMMPGETGLEFLTNIRKTNKKHTSKNIHEQSKKHCFQRGKL